MATARKSIDCEYCGSSGHCYFVSVLPDDVLADLRGRRRTSRVRKGELIFEAGQQPEGFWIVCSGQIKVYRTAQDGKMLIQSLAMDGDLLGHRALLADEAFEETAEALEESVLSFIDRSYIFGLIAHHGELALRFLRTLARELGHSEASATTMAYRNARERLIEALYDLHKLQAARSAVDKEPWRFRLRRQDLAELAGLTLETTVRGLKELEREGVVRLEGRKIEVLQPAVLLSAVGAL
jgi:CRP/FNR family transcriptional regulator